MLDWQFSDVGWNSAQHGIVSLEWMAPLIVDVFFLEYITFASVILHMTSLLLISYLQYQLFQTKSMMSGIINFYVF